MDDGLKQRLVGALVLIALALVFLPTLFHRDQRVRVDQASQLPAKPVFEPVIIESPNIPELAEPKPVSEVFQPPMPSTDTPVASITNPETPTLDTQKPAASSDKSAQVAEAEPASSPSKPAQADVAPATVAEPATPQPVIEPKPDSAKPSVTKAQPVESPKLDAQGVVKSWVLQVASFKDRNRAQLFSQKLLDKGYRAFVRTSSIASGEVSRIFVGPHIDKKSALILKKQLDAEMKIKSLVIEFAP